MIVGVFIILIGVLYLISTIYPDIVIHYDILIAGFIFLLSVYRVLKERRFELFNSFLLLGSVWYILVEFDFIQKPYTNIFWPLIVILVGLSIVFDSKRFKKKYQQQIAEKDGFLNYYGIFGGVDERLKSKDFKGCKIYSIFGGCDLDLREIELKGDIAIDVYSIFGGTTIILPDQYKVILNSTAVFGSNENKAKSDENGTYTIYINAISAFGGCELK